jgi:integrase
MSSPKIRGKHEGTITQLPTGKWFARIQLNGKRQTKTFDNRKQAKAWLDDLARKAATGEITAKGLETPYIEVMESYLKAEMPSKRAGTRMSYESYARTYILPSLGHLKVGQITPQHIQNLINDMRDQGKGARTVAITYTVVRRSLAHAYELRMIGYNPSINVKIVRKKKKVAGFYDENMANQFLMVISGHRYEALFRLAILTGMRESEIMGLKWTDIDWNTGKIRITRQLRRYFWRYRDTKEGYFEAPKTERGTRTVKIVKGSQTWNVLLEHYRKQQDGRKRWTDRGKEWEDNGLIFTTQSGKPISQRNMYRAFIGVLEEAGLPVIRFHDMRHTAASIMLARNLPVTEASAILGHSKTSVTTDIYGHVMPGYEDRAAAVMEEALESIPVELDSPSEVDTNWILTDTNVPYNKQKIPGEAG